MRAKLSHAAALKAPPGLVLFDDQVPGLELHSLKQSKSWYFLYRFEGERRRPALGRFPALQIADAREAARVIARGVAAGVDPLAARRAREAHKAAPTVADLCARYEADASVWADMKAASIEKVQSHLKHYIRTRLGAVKVADVTTQTVNDLTASISACGVNGRPAPIYANRVLSTLSGLLQYAERDALKWRPKNTNPARGDEVKINRERKRKRVAEPRELLRLAEEIDKLEARFPSRVAAIRCILFAGSRVTEMAEAKWSELKGATLVLQSHKTERYGEDRVINLPVQALEEILNQRRVGPAIFGGIDLDDVAYVFELARARAGCPDLQLRDLRRTFISAGNTAGRSLQQMGHLAGHANPATTARYAWLFEGAATEIAQDTANVIAGHMIGKARDKAKRARVIWKRGA